MKRILYLHIGVHRTATSSIQSFMHRNFSRLLEHGYLYPYGVRRHFKVVNALFGGTRTIRNVSADLNRRADGWEQDINAIVLSDEDICERRDLALLAAFQDHFDVRVILSMRQQDVWLESWYLQNIKWQWNPALSHCSFEEFLARREDFHWLHYDRLAGHLESLFGKDRLRLQVFEKDQMPDGPVAAFCRQIGLSDIQGFQSQEPVNQSFSPQMSEFMRRLPLDRMAEADRRTIVQACKTVDEATLGNSARPTERLLSHDQRRAILGAYSEGNATVARRHFDRDRLFFAPLPDPAAPLAALELPADSGALMRDYIAPLFEELVQRGLISAAPQVPAGTPRPVPQGVPG